jgi:DNA-binding NtrC family response regulator
MTAYSTRDLILEAEREGALSVMPKPLVLPVVLQRLEGTLRRSQSVLIVDDDPGFLRSLADALRSGGYAALEAPSIDVALRRLEAHVPTAVVLHLHLGDAEPSESVLAIKRVSPSVALILYSGQEPAVETSRRGFHEGLVFARLRKPFPVESLTELLDKIVSR